MQTLFSTFLDTFWQQIENHGRMLSVYRQHPHCMLFRLFKTLRSRLVLTFSNLFIYSWQNTPGGQFHQPAGAKRKCAGRHHLAQKDAAQFHQQNCNQLYWCTDFEVMPNIYAVYPSLYTIKFSINLLAKKPLIKWLWYWPLVDVYACLLVCVCVCVCCV